MKYPNIRKVITIDKIDMNWELSKEFEEGFPNWD
jgi:hypothetical protein